MSATRGDFLCQSGKIINLLNPKVSQVCMEDIIKPLPQICRYSGGTIHFYSVCQHLLNCYHLAKDGYNYDELTQIYVLLHDATEAYLSDVPTPVKKLIPGYMEIEDNLMNVIYQYFNLERPTVEYQKLIKKVDYEMLAYEIPILIPNLEARKPQIVLKDIELDFKLRDVNEVRNEYEKTLKKLLKNI